MNKNIIYDLKDFTFYNHSCSPNFYHDFQKMTSFALRNIEKGEELTRFYCCNEWEMVAPFNCKCGANNCVKLVGGAKHLHIQKLSEYAHYLAPHIKILVKREIDTVISTLQ